MKICNEYPSLEDLGRSVTFTKGGMQYSGFVTLIEDNEEGYSFGVMLPNLDEESWEGYVSEPWTDWHYTS